jgi:glutamate transport system permease protein
MARSPAYSRVLFDEPGPRGRARIRLYTVLGLVVLAALVALALWQFARNGQLGRSRWLPFLQVSYLRFLGEGLVGTLVATAIAAVLSFPLGVLLALGRLSRTRVLRWVSTGYIELFRGVPLLLLIYAFLLALPRFGINLPLLWKLVVPIVLVNAAVLAEIFRAGVNAVDRGQSEAAAALGLRDGQAMRLVVLPQAVRLVIPSLVTQLVALLKDSTLGYVVSYPELMKQGNNLTVYTHLLVQTYLIVALIYVVANVALSRLATYLERRLGSRVRRRASGSDGPDTGTSDRPEPVAAAPQTMA